MPIEDRGKAKKGNYLANISYLRILATLAVIFLHTFGTVHTVVDKLDRGQRAFYNTGHDLMIWAVPVFFMITGMLLLDVGKAITAEQCIWKYGGRMLLVIFTFGFPLSVLKAIAEAGEIHLSAVVKGARYVISGQGFAHLWYLYALLGVYLILPLLKSFVNATESKAGSSGKREYELVLGALFLLDFAVPTLSKCLDTPIEFHIPLAYPAFYVLLGHYLRRYPVKWMEKKGVDALILAAIGASVALRDYGSPDLPFLSRRAWMNYESPLFALAAAIFFSLFANGAQKKASPVLWGLDRLCFGAYLVHPVLIQFSYRFLKMTPASFPCYPLAAIGLFLAFAIGSFAASWIMRQIKPLGKLL